MKWLNARNILLSRCKNLNARKCLIFFVVTILFFFFWLVDYILFFFEYIFNFPVEASGFTSDSKIQSEDDKFVKVSKIIYSYFIFVCCSFLKVASIVICIPIAIFSLFVDNLRILIQKDSDRYVLSKHLLQN